MSRAQSPTREQSLTMNIVAEKILDLSNAISELKIQISEMKTGEQIRNSITEIPVAENVGKPIVTSNGLTILFFPRNKLTVT